MSRKTRKLIWSAPLVAVFAVVGALALFVALSPNGAQADHVDLPGIVTNVDADAKGRDTIELTWDAPSSGGAVDYYRIDRSLPDDSDNWMRLVTMHTGERSYTDMMGLKPSKSYHYRVFAVNAAGTGPSSDLTESSMANTGDASRPGPVRMLTASVMGPNQIDLSWYPPTSDGGASVVRYCIATAPVGATDGEALPVPDGDGNLTGCTAEAVPTASASTVFNTADADGEGVIVILAPQGSGKVEFMHKKLPASHTRTYEVYAVNSEGISTNATAVAPTPQTETAGKPGKPTLRLVPQGTTTGGVFTPDGSANLYWTWPDDGGKAIERWQLQRKEDSGPWTEVGDATGDDLETGRDIDGPEDTAAGLSPDPLATATNRSVSKTTRFQVRANNGSDGAWSNTVAITIKSTWNVADGNVNPVTTSVTAGVDGLTATSNKYLRQIDLSWTDQAGTSYLIDYAAVSSDVDATADTVTDDDREWKTLQSNTGYTRSTYNNSSGLEPSTSRHYRVISLKNGVYGPIAVVSAKTKDAAKPAAVTGLMTSSDDPTEIDLKWDKPTVDGGHPITGYRVEIGLDNTWPDPTSDDPISPAQDKCPSLDAETICVREVEGADNTMFTLDGLDAASERWFRVFAINKVSRADTTGDAAANFPDADDSRWAEPKKGTSDASGTPGVPLDLTVQPARDANEDDPAKLGIDILWNTPGDPAGDTVTGYVIARRVKESSTASWGAWDDDWGTIDNVNVNSSDFLRTYFTDTDEPDGLADGEMREYKVTAKSGKGSGPTTASVVYPVDTSHASVPPTLTAPSGVTVSTLQDTISVTWDPASIKNADQVKAVLFDDGVTMIVDLKTFNAASDPGAATFTGVDSGTYWVTVASFRTGDPHMLSALMEVTVP